MDQDEVKVHKNVKRKGGQYTAILTELAWSIKDLLYGIKSSEKNDLCTCLFLSTEKEPFTNPKVIANPKVIQM